jgi:hypothetical protein
MQFRRGVRKRAADEIIIKYIHGRRRKITAHLAFLFYNFKKERSDPMITGER